MAAFKGGCIAVTLLLTALAISPALAQESSAVAERCDRAWLASDWSTVAADCSKVGTEDDTIAAWHAQEFVAGATPSATNAQQLTDVVGPNYLVAGEAWTRVAVSYGRLNQQDSYGKARTNALSDLSQARHFGSSETAQKAAAITDLISSESFLTDAPNSPLLAHL
ncbi:MAG TPA: hypothetical protein VHR97_00230 [Candidatus Baltobacteraceae bacterium]|jgi:hypothetical protein|nr:hypothetical protein [Candidatus Baltobacteraceae bacterium]